MDKIYLKIERYLLDNFGKRDLVLDPEMEIDDESDVWGIHSMTIYVKESEDGTLHYKPMFKGGKI